MQFRRYYNLRIDFSRDEENFIMKKLRSEFGKRVSFLEIRSVYLGANLWEEFDGENFEEADRVSCDRAKKIEEEIKEIFKGGFQSVEINHLTIFEKEGGNTFTHRIDKRL